MNKTISALKLAEEALSFYVEDFDCAADVIALAAIREALAEQDKQEPVAWMAKDSEGKHYFRLIKPADTYPVQPLYTTPPSVEAAIEATKAKYEKKFDEVFGELIEKIKGGMSAAAAIRSMK